MATRDIPYETGNYYAIALQPLWRDLRIESKSKYFGSLQWVAQKGILYEDTGDL
jgi:hypothetical protein